MNKFVLYKILKTRKLFLKLNSNKLIIFELYSKIVVGSFHTNIADATELGDIMENCKRLWSFFVQNSSVEFARRETNIVAHCLTKLPIYNACSQSFSDIPNCIEHLIYNNMN